MSDSEWEDEIPKLLAEWDGWQADPYWRYEVDYPDWMERAVVCLREMGEIIQAHRVMQVLKASTR